MTKSGMTLRALRAASLNAGWSDSRRSRRNQTTTARRTGVGRWSVDIDRFSVSKVATRLYNLLTRSVMEASIGFVQTLYTQGTYR